MVPFSLKIKNSNYDLVNSYKKNDKKEGNPEF